MDILEQEGSIHNTSMNGKAGIQQGGASGRYFVTIDSSVVGTTQVNKIDLEDRSDALSRSMGVGSEKYIFLSTSFLVS